MLYNQPYGGAADAPYVNGDPSIGLAGSIPPAASIEYPQREIVNFITDSGITPSNGDLRQLGKSVQNGKVTYAADTGTANAAAITLAPAVTALTSGMVFRFKKMNAANTAAMTLAVNGLTARSIVKMGGGALVSGELVANYPIEVMYDSVLNVFIMLNYAGTTVGTDVTGAISTAINNYITIAPYADINLFSHSNAGLTVPNATYTKCPLSGPTIDTAANVSLVTGSCKILVAGRYFLTLASQSIVNPAVYSVFSIYPGGLYKNGSILHNGSGVSMGNTTDKLKECTGSLAIIADFAANDIIDVMTYQASAAAASGVFNVINSLMIGKVAVAGA